MYEVSSLLELIRRHRFLAVALFVGLLFSGSLTVLLLPRTYVTSAQVLVNRPPSSLPQATEYPQIDALLAWNSDTAMETYIALAQQPAVAQRVIEAMNLSLTPKQLLSRIVVTPLTNANVLNISVDWRDAKGSADVANAFAQAFISRQRVLASAQASEAADSLAIALKQAQSDLAKAEGQLTLFESAHSLADASGQQSAILTAIGDMQAKERSTEADRAQAAGQLASLDTRLSELRAAIQTAKTVGSSPVADQIEAQLAQERVQLSILRRQFTEQYPDVIATEKQIASLEAALAGAPRAKLLSTTTGPNPLSSTLNGQAAGLQAQVAGDSAQLGVLRAQEAALFEQLRDFPADATSLSSLQRTVKSDETIYEDLENRYFNAVVAKRMAVSDLSIVRVAEPDFADVRPSRALALGVVTLASLLATLAIIALLDSSVQLRSARWQSSPG